MLRTLLILLLLYASQLCAGQLSFSNLNGEIHVSWRQGEEVRQATYRLEKDTLPPLLIFSPERFRRDVLQALLQQSAAKWPDVQFRTLGNGELQMLARTPTRAKEARDWIEQTRPAIEQEWLTRYYFQYFTTPDGQQAIKQDHVRIALESRPALATLAEQLKQNGGSDEEARRKTVEAVLDFVQDIPYALLDNNGIRGGRGFLSPRQVLSENRGDCDSKVTLMAAILGQLYPELGQVMVFIPDHALLGVALPPGADDKKLEWEGKTYLLMEPTGPAELPLGKLDRTSAVMVDSKQLQAQPVEPTATNSMATK